MIKVGVRLSVIALAFVALGQPLDRAQAFGLRLGPFFFGLPGHGFHSPHPAAHAHSDANLARTEPSEPKSAGRSELTHRGGPEANQVASNHGPTLLYPDLVLPVLDEEIFWPRSDARWPFGYQTIFDQAFTKYPDRTPADVCRYRDTSGEFAARIAQEIDPRDDQRPVLKQLVTALGQANGYLIKTCPPSIPLRPVARLKLMDAQIDALIMALEIIRAPLQQFERSLDDKQRARWAGADTAEANRIAPCSSTKADQTAWPLPMFQQAVRPTDRQQHALDRLKDAFNRAQSELSEECSGGIPQAASHRLVLIEDRLDATWRAIQTIEVAFTGFQKQLNDEQNARINVLEIASKR